METLALAVQIALAAVFATAGVAKLRDRAGSRQALTDFGLPARLAAPGAVALPVAELVIAPALLVVPLARVAAIAALVLLLAFVGGILRALARGQAPDCHCFGQVHSAPAGRGTVARNALLAVLAAFLALRGPGPALDDWIAARTAAELAATVAGLAAGAFAATAWVLWRRNRVLQRELEAARGASALLPPGLPIGTRAPGFALPGLHGETLTLDSLLSRGRPVALVFADPYCGPCQRLLPDLGRWQAALGDRLTIAVISSGSLLENRAPAQEHGVADMLIQTSSEVMDAYRITNTPTAIVVSADGFVASGPAAAEFEIEELIRLTLERHANAPWTDATL
ncbi:MAG TPA: MauE/DoxX family redox-associated membrane protein [Solirubrobacteraceae bacterium]|nr:MauE/DoxX family redox-associated membrane protein [Solirubrobacteraceae bacterium]